jgi:SnoaL-like domain
LDVLARLAAIEDIRHMRSRYLRMLDTKNWTELAKLYTRDATLAFHTEEPGVVSRGRDEILKRITTLLVDVTTIHYAHTAEIVFQSDARATGIWALEDKLWFGPKSSSPGLRVHAYGHLNDEYCKVDGAWLLQSAEITRLRVDHY